MVENLLQVEELKCEILGDKLEYIGAQALIVELADKVTNVGANTF